MSHDPVRVRVLGDYLLEAGFTRIEVGKALAALDPVAVVITGEEIKRLDQEMAVRYSEWRRPGEPITPVGRRAQMQVCSVAERDMLDIIKAKREGRLPTMPAWGEAK